MTDTKRHAARVISTIDSCLKEYTSLREQGLTDEEIQKRLLEKQQRLTDRVISREIRRQSRLPQGPS